MYKKKRLIRLVNNTFQFIILLYYVPHPATDDLPQIVVGNGTSYTNVKLNRIVTVKDTLRIVARSANDCTIRFTSIRYGNIFCHFNLTKK